MSGVQCLLTDTNSDEECDICEHLSQYVPEVPFSTVVTVLHQLCAPQNCKGNKSRVHQRLYETCLNKYCSKTYSIFFLIGPIQIICQGYEDLNRRFVKPGNSLDKKTS